MDAIVHECGVINDVFESLSINKSLIVINDLRCTYHIDTILKHQLFPVEKLVYVNFNETLERFVTGTLRMMIMSEAMFRVLQIRYPEIFEEISVIFVSQTLVQNCGKDLDDRYKIFSLAI